MSGVYIMKGNRIRAVWLEATQACLAGVQAKVGVTTREVIGVVRHVRGDHPTTPINVRLFVETDDLKGEMCESCGVRELTVDPKHVVEVMSPVM